MNIISKKLTMSLALAGLIAGTVPVLAMDHGNHHHHQEKKKGDFEQVKQLLFAQKKYVLFLLAGSFLTCLKEAVAKPEVVTMEDLKKLAQIQNILSNPQEYFGNIVHLINDGLLGQVGIRGKAVLGITNEEDGSMAFKEVNALPSTGIFGNTLFYAKLVGKKAKDLTNLLLIPSLLGLMLQNTENVAKGKFAKAEAAK